MCQLTNILEAFGMFARMTMFEAQCLPAVTQVNHMDRSLKMCFVHNKYCCVTLSTLHSDKLD